MFRLWGKGVASLKSSTESSEPYLSSLLLAATRTLLVREHTTVFSDGSYDEYF
jgi:hypothetical protein